MTTATDLTAINVLLEELKGMIKNHKQKVILELQIAAIAAVIAGL